MIREVTAASVELLPMATYRAKLQLTGIEATFGTAGIVRQKFQDLGFGTVTVWDQGPPADKFPDVTPYPDGKTFWAEGLWNGGDTPRSLPSQVKRVWVVEPEAAPAPQNAPQNGQTPSPAPTPRPTPRSAPRAPYNGQAPTLQMPEQVITADSGQGGGNWGVLILLAAYALSR